MTEAATERKRQIVVAASVCFARRGFHAATMPEICREAGLSPGTVYRYFRSKDDLIEALVALDLEERLASLQAIDERSDALAAIDHSIDQAMAAVADPLSAALYAEVIAESARNPRVGAAVRRYDELVTDEFARILRRAQDAGQIDPGLDPHVVAELFGDALDGLIVRRALMPDRDAAPYADTLKGLLRRSLSASRGIGEG